MSSSGKTILVIDDEMLVRRVVTHMLTKIGYEAICVETGEEAVETVRANPNAFQAAICDLNLPGICGVECLKQIKSICPELPVYLSTGNLIEDDADFYSKNGADGVMEKPFRIEQLKSLLG